MSIHTALDLLLTRGCSSVDGCSKSSSVIFSFSLCVLCSGFSFDNSSSPHFTQNTLSDRERALKSLPLEI